VQPQLDHRMDIRQYVRVLWRRKAIVILCAVTAVCAAVIGLQFVSPTYESRVTLLVADRQPFAPEVEKVMGYLRAPTKRYGEDEERMTRFVGRIRSHVFLERVARLLKMHEDEEVRAEARKHLRPGGNEDALATRIVVERLQSQIRFGSRGAGIYQVIVGDPDPAHAQTLARWISEVFVDVSVQNSLRQLKDAREFGVQQLQIYERTLRDAEARLEERRTQEIEQGLDVRLVGDGNIGVAEALLANVEEEAAASRLRVRPALDELDARGVDLEWAPSVAVPGVQAQVDLLASSLRDEIEARLASPTGGSADWPPQGRYSVIRRQALRGVKALVEEAGPDQPGHVREAVVRLLFARVDRAAHSDATSFLREAIRQFRTYAQSKPRDELELARLIADVETKRSLLRSFESQLVASDVNQAMEATDLGTQIEILDPAQLPLEPSHPDKVKILLIAAFLGPLIGIGLAFLTETMDGTLRSLDDFRAVASEPILGTTPLMGRLQAGRVGWWRRNWAPVAATSVLLVTGAVMAVGPRIIDQMDLKQRPVQVIAPGP